MIEDNYLVAVAFILLVLPFVVAILVALFPAAQPNSISDYFLYRRKLTANEFVRTSVGYSLQVAAIILFSFWVFNYGWWAIFAPIAWGLGYVLVIYAIRKGWLDDFLTSDGNQIRTIHGYVGSCLESRTHSRQKLLVLVLAGTTIIAIGGTLVAEIDYATSFVSGTLKMNLENNSFAKLSIQGIVLAFAGAYVMWGGYKAVIKTDKVLVPIAYVCFVLTIYLVSYKAHSIVGNTVLAPLLITLFYLCGATYYRHKTYEGETALDFEKQTSMYTYIFLIFVGLFTILLLINQPGGTDEYSVSLFPDSGVTMGFGVLGILSLVVTNAIWQFIDISSLQRLQSVDVGGGDQQLEIDKNKVVSGLRAAGYESAGMWILIMILATLFGMLGATSMDGANSIYSILQNLEGLYVLIPFALLLVVSIFMLSTIDGFISAIVYVWYYDFLKKKDHVHENNLDADLLEPRLLTITSLVVIFMAYYVLKLSLPDSTQLATILYAIYAVQITLAPTILIAFISPKRLSSLASISSITIGVILALISVQVPPVMGIEADSWYVMPTLIAVGSSIIVYAMVFFLQRYFQKVN